MAGWVINFLFVVDFTLRLPGFHLHVAKYIDARKHHLRYTLKNKKLDKEILVVVFTLLVEGSEEEIMERDSSANGGEEGGAGSSSEEKEGEDQGEQRTT
jgi:hypothetical protein